MRRISCTAVAIALFLGLGAGAARAQGGPGGAPGPGPTPDPWINNYPTLSYDAGGLALPTAVTGGGKGPGTINITGPYYIGGTAILSMTSAVSPLNFSAGVLSLGTVGVSKGGTGQTTFTNNLPLIGNGASAIAQGTVSGNTTLFGTVSGSLISGNCVKSDASHNLIDAGNICGGTSSVSNSDGTLTITPATGPVVASLALAHANIWTAVQKFNLNSGSLQAGQTGAIVQMGNANGVISRLEIDSYAAASHISGVRADGTTTSPTALQANEEIVSLNAWGYATSFVGPRAGFRCYSDQIWTVSAQGTYCDIVTTPDGATAMAEIVKFNNDGGVIFGAPTGGNKGAGTLNTAGGIYQNGVGPLVASAFTDTTNASNISSGTIPSGRLTGATGLPISTGVSGLGANVATALGSALNGTGAVSATTNVALVTPNLGVPSAIDITNATGSPVLTQLSTTGGTGVNISNAVPVLTLNKTASGQNNSINGQTAGVARWLIVPGNQTAEGGTADGSDFALAAFNNAGTFLNSWFVMTRSNGNGNFVSTTASTSSTTGAVIVGGGLGVAGAIFAGTNITASGQAFIPNMTASSVATTGTVCWTTATGKLTVDTTVGCLTSIAAAKNIVSRPSPKQALDLVMKLSPASFRYRKGYGDSGHYEQFGLIAEEAASVDERLAGRDPDGVLQGVRYQELTAVLVGAIQELRADNDNLRAELRRRAN